MSDDGRAQARKAVLEHVDCWNAADKERWLRIFADDVAYEDPPGTVVGRGRQVMSDYAWDRSFTADKRWILEPVVLIACGNEAQVYMRNHGAVGGLPTWVDSIELWQVDAAGLVTSVRAFWEPPDDAHVRSHLSLNEWQAAEPAS